MCASTGCEVQFEQPATGRRRRYCSDRCRQAGHRTVFRDTTPPRPSASLPTMAAEVRFHGGHLERDQSSVIDGCRHDQRIDTQLHRILGGIPKPRAPRSPVVELRVARDIPVTETVAA